MIDLDALVIGPCIAVFGQDVVYTAAADGVARPMTAVFDEEYLSLSPLGAGMDDRMGMPSNITSAKPVLGVQLSQLAVTPMQGDGVLIVLTGQTFTVVEVQPDGHGAAKLILNEAG